MPPKRKGVKASLDVFDFKDETATSPRTKAGKAFYGIFDEVSSKSPSKSPKKPMKAPAPTPQKQKRKSLAKSEILFEFSSSSEDEAPSPPPTSSLKRSRAARRQPASEDDEPVPTTPKKATPKKGGKVSGDKKSSAKKATPKRKAVVKQPESDTEEEEVLKKPAFKKGKQPESDTESEEEPPLKKPTPKKGKQPEPDTESEEETVKPVLKGKQPEPDTESEEEVKVVVKKVSGAKRKKPLGGSDHSAEPPVKGRKSVQVVAEPTATAVFKPGNPSNVWGTEDFDYDKQEREEEAAVLKERRMAVAKEKSKTGGRLSSTPQVFSILNVPVNIDTGSLTVRELKEELAARSLLTTGNKATLVARLEKAVDPERSGMSKEEPKEAKPKSKKPPAKPAKKGPKKRDSMVQLTFDDVTCDSDVSLSSNEALPLEAAAKGKRAKKSKKA
eukprot:TRINITY_DN10720_c0_g1_i1.p1 TRINITY_DN10720_c0_g1~~TRINITY_DN10720_c0_g1_i1.p1  ORF type:complete len:443 (+),score=115.07 TRINITY_DN10720_c0_g1_i1:20-1348(+)